MHIIYAAVPRNRPGHLPTPRMARLVQSPRSYTGRPHNRSLSIDPTSRKIEPRVGAPLL